MIYFENYSCLVLANNGLLDCSNIKEQIGCVEQIDHDSP